MHACIMHLPVGPYVLCFVCMHQACLRASVVAVCTAVTSLVSPSSSTTLCTCARVCVFVIVRVCTCVCAQVRAGGGHVVAGRGAVHPPQRHAPFRRQHALRAGPSICGCVCVYEDMYVCMCTFVCMYGWECELHDRVPVILVLATAAHGSSILCLPTNHPIFFPSPHNTHRSARPPTRWTARSGRAWVRRPKTSCASCSPHRPSTDSGPTRWGGLGVLRAFGVCVCVCVCLCLCLCVHMTRSNTHTRTHTQALRHPWFAQAEGDTSSEATQHTQATRPPPAEGEEGAAPVRERWALGAALHSCACGAC
jgi:hypothetical protein